MTPGSKTAIQEPNQIIPTAADLNISHVNHPCKASLYTNTCTMCIVQCASSIFLNMYTCMQIYVHHFEPPAESIPIQKIR